MIKRKMKFKIDKNFLTVLCLFLITRVGLLLLSNIFNLIPYMSYDDYIQYDRITLKTSSTIFYYLRIRQIFLWICAVLNTFHINDYINGPRIFNLILSLFICIDLKQLSQYIGFDKKKSKKFIIFFIILPFYIIFLSSEYKDVLCLYLTLKFFIFYFEYIEHKQINYGKLLICSLLLYFCRYGVLESLIIFFTMDYIIRTKKFRYKLFTIIAIITIFSAIFSYDSTYFIIMLQKMARFTEDVSSTGLLSKIAVRSIKDIWKLPLLIFYGQISPLPTNKPDLGINSWSSVLGIISFFQYFFVPFFWYSVLFQKKNQKEKLLLYFYFIWLIILLIASPAIQRFHFFISFIFYIFSYKGLYHCKTIFPYIFSVFSLLFFVLFVIYKF